ncbi:MAG: hypothetical protein V1928_02245 [Parcubacteria group bacterium]
MDNKITDLYKALRKKHGRPSGQWRLWCKRPKSTAEREEVIIGAILAQNTNWKNVELSLNKLKKAKRCSLDEIYKLGKRNMPGLAELIRPSGFYNSKAKYLLAAAAFFCENGGVERIKNQKIKKSRKQLLELKGVGPETADSILLYALDKPAFVIDEYTRRILNYDRLQKIFESRLPRNYKAYQDFHALIVIEGKGYPGLTNHS